MLIHTLIVCMCSDFGINKCSAHGKILLNVLTYLENKLECTCLCVCLHTQGTFECQI